LRTASPRSTARWRPSPISSAAATDLWDELADGAAAESALWRDALRPGADRERIAIFSPLAEPRLALAIETIYEGYLVHYGRSRLFAPADADTALLLGDYLYAHGLVRVAELGDVEAVRVLAELISLCAHLRADGSGGDGEAWVATAAGLGEGSPARSEVDRALAAHRLRVG
jgi:hypothetical protein